MPSFPGMLCQQQHAWTLRTLSIARAARASPLIVEIIFLGGKCHLQLTPWDSLPIAQQHLTWKQDEVDTSGPECSESECRGLGAGGGWGGKHGPSHCDASHKFFLSSSYNLEWGAVKVMLTTGSVLLPEKTAKLS